MCVCSEGGCVSVGVRVCTGVYEQSESEQRKAEREVGGAEHLSLSFDSFVRCYVLFFLYLKDVACCPQIYLHKSCLALLL